MFNFIYKVHVYLLKCEKKLFIKNAEKYGNHALWNKIMPPNLGIKTQTTMRHFEFEFKWSKYIILVYIWEDFFYYNSIWLKTILFFFLSNYFFFLTRRIEKRRETIISLTSPYKTFYLFPMHFFTIILSI